MEYKHFFKSLFLIMLLALAVWSPLLYFNTVVDPYGIFLKIYKQFPTEPNKRFMKMRFLKKNPTKFDSFIFGSSRVNSINPSKIPDSHFYNMTYSLGLPNDHIKDIEYLIKNGIKIKNLLIGIDYLALLNNPVNNEEILYRKKYPESLKEFFDFYSTYLFYRPNLEFVKLMRIDGKLNWDDFYEFGILRSSHNEWIEKNQEKHVMGPKFKIPDSKFNPNSSIDLNMKIIENLVELARKNNINLYIFTNPIHFTSQLSINLDDYQEALRQLARITDFYDFSGLNSVTLNNLYFHETSHYREMVGDMILAKIFGYPKVAVPEDFGFHVDSTNVENLIALHRNQLQTYFNAINLNKKYTPCYIANSIMAKVDTEKVKILSINGIIPCNDTMLISSPIINVTGISTIDLDVNDYCLLIGDKSFKMFRSPNGSLIHKSRIAIDKTKSPETKEWECVVSTRFIEPGCHKLRITGLGNSKDEGGTACFLKIVKTNTQSLVLDSLDHSQESAIFETSFSTTTLFPSVQKYLYFDGWAVDEETLSVTGGIIATIGNDVFESQLVMERLEIRSKFNSSKAKYAGWGITLPGNLLREGRNEIVFAVLRPDRKSLYNTKQVVIVNNITNDSADYLQGLELRDFTTGFTLDILNQKLVSQLVQPVRINENHITMQGWAVDNERCGLAKNVVVIIDGRQFLANYGLTRVDVARALKNMGYEKSGWQFNLPVQAIGVGLHEISFCVIAGDGLSYYNIPTSVQIKVE